VGGGILLKNIPFLWELGFLFYRFVYARKITWANIGIDFDVYCSMYVNRRTLKALNSTF
jgi:hypothetical protein